MMGEILDDQDAPLFAFDFHALADADESGHGALDGFAFDAAAVGDGDGRERVENVVPSGDRHANAGDFPAAKGHAKFGGVVVPMNIAGAPIAFGGKAEGFDGAKRFCDGFLKLCALAPDQDFAAARNEIDEAAKLQGDGSEVGINIGVIVFERGEDQLVGMIVEKFRAAVEEGGFVLVAFDDELFAAAEAVAAFAEIRGDAADQEIGRRPAT